MKLAAQIISLVGIAISALYSYLKGWPFEGVTALLGFCGTYISTFFMSAPSGSMSQKTGDNSNAYQSGRDININK
jgi:hypothetical protein